MVENMLTIANLLDRLTALEAKVAHLEVENVRLQAENADCIDARCQFSGMTAACLQTELLGKSVCIMYANDVGFIPSCGVA